MGEMLTAESQPIDVGSCPPPHRDDRLVAGADHLERLTVRATDRCSLSRIASPDGHIVDAREPHADRTDLVEPTTAASRHSDQHVRAVAIDPGGNQHRSTPRPRRRVSSGPASRPQCLGGDGMRKQAERETQKRARSDEHHRDRAEGVHERFSMVDGTERSRQGADLRPPLRLDDHAATFADRRDPRPPVSVRSEVLLGREGAVARRGIHGDR